METHLLRRSIQKQIEYRCLRDGKCLVIRLNRNRCQYCRFKKCLAVGMSRDSVRYGRVPKRSRERSGEEPATATRVSTSDAEQSDAETKQLAVYDVILTVSQAFHANCGYTEEQTRGLVRKPLQAQPPAAAGGSSPEGPEVASSTAESLEQQRVWLWQQFATHVTPSVQRVVEFAKRVPGFCDLSQDDQLILIKVGFFEIWLGHVARLTSDSSLTFADGTYITRQQMDIMYDPEFVSSLFHFASTLNALALNDTELGLFSAIVLLTADRPGVTDLKAIEHHQDRLIDALKVQTTAKSFRIHTQERATAAVIAIHDITDITQLALSTAMQLFYAKILPILSYGLDITWTRLNYNDLKTMENVKARFLKAALGISKYAPSRMAYELAREPFLIEELRSRLMLPSTAAELRLRTVMQEKKAEIESEFYGTDAMINRNWTGPNNKLRSAITRLAVQGFHHKLCRRSEYHEPSPECVCKLCNEACPKYHFSKCVNRTKSLVEYSKEK
ncbi:hypothetical protein ANN_21724 [Periplaneta americana]|uniref:Ecdysone-induced protein 78C n=1 Tax=Periplaneta americana TaxID=6978 RepID=A0ABQ8S718_PERAM|nr:hypothetical protein ANN_21724 [Periplaneta americana]